MNITGVTREEVLNKCEPLVIDVDAICLLEVQYHQTKFTGS